MTGMKHNKALVPIRTGEAPVLVAQRGRYSYENMKTLVASALFFLTLGAVPSGFASASKAEAVVAVFLKAHNSHDVDAVLATLADVVDMRILLADGTPESKRLLNRTQQREVFATAFRVNPNARFRVLSQVTSGGTVVVRDEGTGMVGGVQQAGLTLYRVQGDKIAAIWIVNTEAEHREKG